MSLPPSTRDPWADVTSARSFRCDELVSALQKYILRGNLDETLLVAREMYETSPELEAHLWNRLMVISASSCNNGTFLQTPIVESLHRVGMRMQRGRKMGRGVAHFLDEGTVITHQYEGADPPFGERVRETVARGEWG